MKLQRPSANSNTHVIAMEHPHNNCVPLTINFATCDLLMIHRLQTERRRDATPVCTRYPDGGARKIDVVYSFGRQILGNTQHCIEWVESQVVSQKPFSSPPGCVQCPASIHSIAIMHYSSTIWWHCLVFNGQLATLALLPNDVCVCGMFVDIVAPHNTNEWQTQLTVVCIVLWIVHYSNTTRSTRLGSAQARKSTCVVLCTMTQFIFHILWCFVYVRLERCGYLVFGQRIFQLVVSTAMIGSCRLGANDNMARRHGKSGATILYVYCSSVLSNGRPMR